MGKPNLRKTPVGKIFCCEKLGYVKSSRPILFRSSRQVLFCSENFLKLPKKILDIESYF